MGDINFTLPKDWQSTWETDPTQGPKITKEQAAVLLAKRLLGGGFAIGADTRGKSAGVPGTYNQTNVDKSRMIYNLVEMIPPEMLTEDVLTRVDLRSLLSPILATEYQAKKRGDITVNGKTFTPAMQMAAGSMFVDEKRKMTEQLEQSLADAGFPPDEIKDLAAQELAKYRESPGSLIPMAAPQGQVILDPTTGAVQTAGANTDTSDFATLLQQALGGAGTEKDQRPAFMTADDVRLLFRDATPGSALGGYMNDLGQRGAYESAGLGDAPPDPTRIQMDDRPLAGPYMRPGASAEAKATARNQQGTYTLTEAASLPLTMTRAEIQKLSDKMEKAGLFAQVGGTPIVKGDSTDPQFKEAYRLLLAKSIQRREPVSTVLQTDMLAYSEELEDKVRARLTDPARIRASADSLGRQILGRKLSGQDRGKLVDFIHKLEHDQAMQEADEDGGDVTEVDWESRMAEYIKNANPGEAGAHDLAGQYDVFRGLLAGPGGQG